MRNEIEKVLEAMREDYKRWSNNTDDSEIKTEMEEDYCNGLTVTEGSRYYKIVSETRGSKSVQGFVVKAGDKKFLEGDLLKAAGWAAPARNFPRGNVLTESWCYQNVRWTGIG